MLSTKQVGRSNEPASEANSANNKGPVNKATVACATLPGASVPAATAPLNLVLCGFPRLHAAGLQRLLQEGENPMTVSIDGQRSQLHDYSRDGVQASASSTDLVIVHLGMDGCSNDVEFKKMMNRYLGTPVLALYDRKLVRRAQQTLALGARGVLPNNATVPTLLLTIKAVLLGRVVDSTRLQTNRVSHNTALQHNASLQDATKAVSVKTAAPAPGMQSGIGTNTNSVDNEIDSERHLKLTPRQLQVLASLSEGKPNKLIARDLDVSENTVKAHLKSVFRILGAKNRTEAVSQANRYNLVA